MSHADRHQHLRARTAPPSLLADAAHDVVHVSDDAEEFLRVGAGAPTRNVLQLVLPGLRDAVRDALEEAGRTSIGSATAFDVPLGTDRRGVRVQARRDADSGLFLILFDAAPPEPSGDDRDARSLTRDLAEARENLQLATEEFEASREELRVQNDEYRAVNDQLRATTRALRAANETAAATTQEVQRVNDELSANLDELDRTRGDLDNLIVSANLATLFLDRGVGSPGTELEFAL